MARFLFSSQFAAQQSWITIPRFVPLPSAVNELGNHNNSLVCGRCFGSIEANAENIQSTFTRPSADDPDGVFITKCHDCRQCFHLRCIVVLEDQMLDQRRNNHFKHGGNSTTSTHQEDYGWYETLTAR